MERKKHTFSSFRCQNGSFLVESHDLTNSIWSSIAKLPIPISTYTLSTPPNILCSCLLAVRVFTLNQTYFSLSPHLIRREKVFIAIQTHHLNRLLAIN